MTAGFFTIPEALFSLLTASPRVLLIGQPQPQLITQLLDAGVDCWLADHRSQVLEPLENAFPALPKRLVRWDRFHPEEFAGTDVVLLGHPLPPVPDVSRFVAQLATIARQVIFATSDPQPPSTSLTASQLAALLPGWQIQSIPSGHGLALVSTRPGIPTSVPDPLQFSMDDALLWCTRRQILSFGVRMATVTWGYEWIRQQMEILGLAGKTLVDLGSGQSNPLIEWYAQRADHSYLIDLINPAVPLPKTQTIVSDLEKPLPLPDASCDLAVSVSVLEHLTAEGRLLQMRELGRVLRPGGHALITVSNLFHLDADALDALAQEPWLNTRGNQISAPLNVAAMIHASPHLAPAGPIRCGNFPGIAGYDPSAILAQPNLLVMNVANCSWATFQPRTDALAIPWAEVGMHLIRK